jgi:hypothetical protein
MDDIISHLAISSPKVDTYRTEVPYSERHETHLKQNLNYTEIFTIFRDGIPFSYINRQQYFAETYCLHLQVGRQWWTPSFSETFIANYMVPYLRKQ